MKKFILILFFTLVCFAPRTMAMGSSEPNFSVEEEVSAVSIIATDQGVRVLNANGATLEIYNLVGVKIASYRIDSTDKNITLTLGKGCYLFKVRGVVRKISIR